MPRPARRIPAARAMIVAPQPEAVEAGATVLAAGGNALDAVLACAFTQGVVDPLMCGIGGLGSLQLHDPRTGKTEVFDGLSTCPAAASPEMWSAIFERECPDGFGYVLRGFVNELGRTAVTTPGILRVFAAAHAAYGRASWSDLLAPAIGFATDGWIIRPHVTGVFGMDESAYGRVSYREKLALTEDGRRIYMRPDGTPKRLGETVRNPDLAATLGIIARDGAEAFYNGEIARRIAADMAAHGGLLTEADLAGFKPRQRHAVDHYVSQPNRLRPAAARGRHRRRGDATHSRAFRSHRTRSQLARLYPGRGRGDEDRRAGQGGAHRGP